MADPQQFDATFAGQGFTLTGRLTMTPVAPPVPPVVPPIVPPVPPPNPNVIDAVPIPWQGVINGGWRLTQIDHVEGGFTLDPNKNQFAVAANRSRVVFYGVPAMGVGADPAAYPMLTPARTTADWGWVYPHNYGIEFGAYDFHTGTNAWEDFFVAPDDPEVLAGTKRANPTGSNTGLITRSLGYFDGEVYAAISEYYGHGAPRPTTGATQYSDVVWSSESGKEIRFAGSDCGYWGGMLKDAATLGKIPLRTGGGSWSTNSYPMLPTVMGADGRILLNSVSAKAPPSDRPLAINDVVFADGTDPDFGAGVGLVTIDGKQYRHWTMCERITGTFKLGDKYYGTIVKQPFTPPGSKDPKDFFSYQNQGPYYTTMTFYGKSRLYLAKIKPDGSAAWGNYPDDYLFEETPFVDPIGFEFLPDGRLMVLDGNWGNDPIVYVCDMSAYRK